jgi:hypothetical protein
MHKLVFLLVMLLLEAAAAIAVAAQPPACLMEPKHPAIQVPGRGLRWLQGEDLEGACDAVLTSAWVRLLSKPFDILVYADGPSGSGRFWTVTVGLASKQQKDPSRGFCLQTSTVGWRTLQQFRRSPLPWTDAGNGKGSPRAIIWDSFPLSAEASSAEYGLVAWVYQADSTGRFTIDWGMSRKIAAELAAAYRTPLGRDQTWLQPLRDTAAQALAAFATARCTTRAERAR